MPALSRAVLSYVMACFLSALALAQATLSVPENLVVGDDVTISYSDPARAGQTITVKITGGFPETTEYLDIHLDEQGRGSVTWTVPDWASAHFNAPGVSETTRLIE